MQMTLDLLAPDATLNPSKNGLRLRKRRFCSLAPCLSKRLLAPAITGWGFSFLDKLPANRSLVPDVPLIVSGIKLSHRRAFIHTCSKQQE